MAAGLLYSPGSMPARDRNGRATIGRIRVYTDNTTTPITVYTGSGLGTALSQPITSDDAGNFPLIWIDSANTPVTLSYEDDAGQTRTVTGLTTALSSTAAALEAYSGGVSFTFSTTTTDADPGAGNLRANNATVASITSLFVDNADANANTVSSWVDTFDDPNSSAIRGTLYVRSTANAAHLMAFTVSGAVTDGTGYRKVSVSGGVGTLPTNGATVVLCFSPAGPAGPTGAAGSAGAAGAAGATGPVTWATPAAWLTSTAYTATAPASVVTQSGSSYVCAISHTSGTFATDLAATKWVLIASKGDTGATGAGTTGPAAWQAPTAWLTSTAYTASDPKSVVTQAGETYVCATSHTSGAFSTDLAAVKWIKVAAKGADGAGVGDVVGPASATDGHLVGFDTISGKLIKDLGPISAVGLTLVGAATQALMRTTGLGMSANGSSLVAASDYAAMKVLLGLTIGTNVQAYDADLTTWATITPATGVGTFLATPSGANLRAAVTDVTGSGALVFATSPTLVAPVLGTPASGTLTNCTGLPVAGGGTGAATLAAHGVLIGNGTSAVAVSGAGTAGQVLTSNGASADPTFQAAANGLALLATLTASSSASLSDTTHFTSSYDSYQITFENVVPATNTQGFVIQVTENAGGAWADAFAATTSTGGAITFSNTANTGFSGFAFLTNPNSAANYKMMSGAGYSGTGNVPFAIGGISPAVNALNGLLFKFASGNIASGVIRIYGVKTS